MILINKYDMMRNITTPIQKTYKLIKFKMNQQALIRESGLLH